MIESNLNSLRR